jgi:hypothetical protein
MLVAKRDSHSSNSPEKRDSKSEKRSRFHFPHFSRTSAAAAPRPHGSSEEDVFHEVKGEDEEGA